MDQLKVSIIVPVYNEEVLIDECLSSLINLDFDKSNYEIVVINDGSTDQTLNTIEENKKQADLTGLGFQIINFPNNRGRVIARETGAKAAKYKDLFFVDSRCIADKNILKAIENINYNPIIGNPIINYNDDILGRFLWLSRKFIYKPEYFNDTLKPVFITEENFDEVGKGLGMCFCDKELFLDSQLSCKDQNVSDDVKLFRNMINKKKILRHPDVKVHYKHRNSLYTELNHTFHRGPKFVDYYLDPRKKFFWPFIFLPIFTLFALVIALVLNLKLFFLLITSIFFLLTLLIIFMSKKISDVFLLLFLLPLMGIAFEGGIIKGLILKLLKKY